MSRQYSFNIYVSGTSSTFQSDLDTALSALGYDCYFPDYYKVSSYSSDESTIVQEFLNTVNSIDKTGLSIQVTYSKNVVIF